jgi:hypothetical protein
MLLVDPEDKLVVEMLIQVLYLEAVGVVESKVRAVVALERYFKVGFLQILQLLLLEQVERVSSAHLVVAVPTLLVEQVERVSMPEEAVVQQPPVLLAVLAVLVYLALGEQAEQVLRVRVAVAVAVLESLLLEQTVLTELEQ